MSTKEFGSSTSTFGLKVTYRNGNVEKHWYGTASDRTWMKNKMTGSDIKKIELISR